MLSSWWIDNVLLDAPCGQQQMFTDGQNQKGQFVVHQTIILDVPCGHAAADVPRRPVLAQDLSVPVQRETPLHQEPVRPQKNAERPNDTLYCVLCRIVAACYLFAMQRGSAARTTMVNASCISPDAASRYPRRPRPGVCALRRLAQSCRMLLRVPLRHLLVDSCRGVGGPLSLTLLGLSTNQSLDDWVIDLPTFLRAT